MKLIAIEIRNVPFKCESCNNKSFIKYITDNYNVCESCLEQNNVKKYKENYTPSIIADYESPFQKNLELVNIKFNQQFQKLT